MKKFNSKSLLVILLAAIMIFSYLPRSAQAAEGDVESTYADAITIEVGQTKELTVPGLAVNEATVEDDTKVTLDSVVGTPGGKNLAEVTAADGFDGSKQYVIVSERSATEGLLTNEAYTATISWSGLQITGLKTNGAVSADTAHLWTIKFVTDKYEIKYGNQYLAFNYGSTSTASLTDEASYVNLQRDGDYWYITNAAGIYLSNPGGFVNGYYGAAGFNEKGGSGWKFFELVSSEASTKITITGVAAGDTTVRVGELVYKITVTAPSVDGGHHYDNGFCTDAGCGAYEPAELLDGVYQITNGGQLYWFMELVNAGTTDADAILVNNITVNAGTFAANGAYTAAAGETVRNWVPMGTSDAPYVGSFDGNNKTVSGLYVNKTGTAAEDRFVGFISYLGESGAVKNLTIANAYFYGNRNVAAVVSQNKGTVEGCVNSGYVGSSDMICGGVVANNYGTVKRCTNNGTVNSGGSSVGGVVGNNESAGTVTNCTNTGSVTSTSKYAGGIVGDNAGAITGGTNSGAVTGANTAGGIAARSTGDVSGSTNSGNITAGSEVGGIVGMANCNVTNCSNSGTVTASSGAGAGGIVGLGGGVISECYNTGAISGKSSAGGIAGQIGGTVNQGNGTQTISMIVRDCYNSGTVGGTSNSYHIGGVVGYVYNASSGVEDCYNIGTVSNNGKYSPQYVGAIVGRNGGTVTNSYYLTDCAKNGNGNKQYGIGAKDKTGTTADVAGSTTVKTADQFASGEVAYLLNGSTDQGTLVWKQTLGSANAPGFVGETVYAGYDSCADDAQPTGYSNDPNSATKPEHDWDDATCEAPKTCSVCGKTDGDKLPHSFSNYVSDNNASCTEDGTKTAKCDNCDATDTITDEGSAKGHAWGDWEVTTEATYSKGGEETRKCTVCDKTETRSTDRKDLPFVDVEADSFYDMPVRWAVDNGITNGTDETHFSPLDVCNRAQVVTFLWRAAGCPEPETTENPFVDVPETEFYYKAVLWAVEEGITNGMDETHFKPEAYCNRAQIVTFLWRAAGRPEPTSNENPFVDVPETEFYYEAVLWAVENDITNGMDETHFKPGADCNRAQVVTFLYRVYND